MWKSIEGNKNEEAGRRLKVEEEENFKTAKDMDSGEQG